MPHTSQKLFRTADGQIKEMLSHIEGISFRESPLDFFILLARYKFAIRFLKNADRVLDAGCGHGHGTVFLSQFAGHVTGADFDKDLVQSNNRSYRDIPNVSFDTLDLLNVSPQYDPFDVVISLDVIEHFTKEQTEVVAANYSRLTKQDGFAIIGTPNIASQP